MRLGAPGALVHSWVAARPGCRFTRKFKGPAKGESTDGLSGPHWLPVPVPLPAHHPPWLSLPPHSDPSASLVPLTIRSGGNRAWVILAMFSKENWKEQLNRRKSWKMAGQSRGQMSCCPLKVEMVMESVQKEQGCMPVKPPSMYRCGAGGAHEKHSSGVTGPLPHSGHQRKGSWDFPNGPEVNTLPSQWKGRGVGAWHGFDP